MATHIEMHRLAGDPVAVRSLARHLLTLPGAAWTDWELDFLDHMAMHAGPGPLTLRQSEVLSELRDNVQVYSRIDGFSVKGLIQSCWLARADLEDDEEAFVAGLHATGASSLKRRQLLRLMLVARQLGVIEGYVRLA